MDFKSSGLDLRKDSSVKYSGVKHSKDSSVKQSQEFGKDSSVKDFNVKHSGKDSCLTLFQYHVLLDNLQFSYSTIVSVEKTSIENLLAFHYHPIGLIKAPKYNQISEYQRMGVDDTCWRLSSINQNFNYSPTYPRLIGVPAKISDNVLRHIGKFRSKSRIPALSYLHSNKISITRSAQPMTGLAQNRSIQDEKLVEAIFSSSPTEILKGYNHLIIDARPTANAMAQTAMGAGTENTDYYPGSKLVFLGIDNIHVVRDSMNKLFDACLSEDSVSRSALEKSGWLKHVKNIIDGTLMIVKSVHVHNAHVLVHCSDGWDRTAQLCSLAQICLDPYFRTINGLQMLLEKEWVSFGHKFKDRCGHLTKSRKKDEKRTLNAQLSQAGSSFTLAAKNLLSSKFGIQMSFDGGGNQLLASSETITPNNVAPREISPVFPQFLDCLYQIWTEFPTHFEYDERLLGFLFTHTYSCQFGDFLFNNEQERSSFNLNGKTIDECTVSIWDHIYTYRNEFLNPLYVPNTHEGDGTGKVDISGTPGTVSESGVVLFPSSRNLKYWSWFYFKSTKEPIIPTLETTILTDLQSSHLDPSLPSRKLVANDYPNPWADGNEAIDMQPIK